MKIKTLTAALACALPMTGAFAAALDRSGQSIGSFLQPGNYFEAGVSILSPEVKGKENPPTNRKIDDMGNSYIFANAAVKIQLNDLFSFGLIFDQPFGASAAYSGNNIFVSQTGDQVLAPATMATMRTSRIESETNNAVALLTTGSTLSQDHPLYAQQQQVQALINYYVAQQIAATGAPEEVIRPTVITNVIAQITPDVVQSVTTQVDAALNAVNSTLGGDGGGTRVSVKTENISMLFGVTPIQNITFYAGPVLQFIEGDVSLRGQAYSIYNGYDAKIKSTDGWGWLAGAAYQIPEIALKASITYRSEIDHKVDANDLNETISGIGALSLLDPVNGATIAAGIQNSKGGTIITTPQSVNLDLQSGIMADTVAFTNIRWVNWKDFAIRPHQFGLLANVVGQLPTINRPNGFNLVEYSDDQWSVTAGIGRKLNTKWAGNVSVGWDSGAGNPTSTLGPTEGYYNVGIGVQYSPAENYFVAGGVKYFWLGDAKAQTGAQAGTSDSVGEFTDNTAIAFGLKLGYRF